MTGENAITLVGWGNQARAWAANLRDSGWKVYVVLRPRSPSLAAAQTVATVITEGRLPFCPVVFLVPDQEIPMALAQLAPRMIPNQVVYYAHGYALMDGKLNEKFPLFHHVLLAPKAIGTEVRATYLDRRPLGGVYSVEKVPESARHEVEKLTLRLSRSLGITLGPFSCTVRDETIADLFSEQAVLCSLIPESCRIAFDMLKERGIPDELAFFELWHEVGLIVKTMVDKGPEAFFHLISPNALIGAEKGRLLLIDNKLEAKMEKLLRDIEDGTFQKEVPAANVDALRAQAIQRWSESELGQTAARMQKMMKERP